MAQQLQVLRKRVLGRVNTPADHAVMKIKANDIINDAIQEFLSAASWYFQLVVATVALVNSQKQYALSTDMDKLVDSEVRLAGTFTRLYYINEKEFDLVVESPLVGGTPTHYTLRGYKLIQLYPIPNAAAVTAETNLSYLYFKTSTLLSADTDPSPLPDKYDAVMVHRAEAIAHGIQGNEALSARADARYEKAMALALVDNRQVLELSSRDLTPTAPIDQRQGRGTDQRFLR